MIIFENKIITVSIAHFNVSIRYMESSSGTVKVLSKLKYECR